MKSWVIGLLLIVHSSAAFASAPPRVIRLQTVAKNLDHPVDITTDGTDRLFIVEQPGRIRLMENGVVAKQPYLDLVSQVHYQGECGLLGMTFHPDFAKNGFFYVNYTTKKGGPLRTIVSEFKVDPKATKADRVTEREIISIKQPYPNHNGGQIKFGPDGMLYIGMGDGGSANDPENRAQDPKDLLGKILRLDITPRQGYAIPKDNPFVGNDDFRPEIWAWGLRNPWRFSFDRKTGECFTGDVGQNLWEEIDMLVAGGNYGWRLREGLHEFRKERGATDLIDPIVEYGRQKGLSVTGGVVYRGKRFPSLEGIYFYGDYASGRFWGLRYEDGKVLANEELNILLDGKPALNRVQPSAFGEDKDGEVLVCDHSRGLLHVIVAE